MKQSIVAPVEHFYFSNFGLLAEERAAEQQTLLLSNPHFSEKWHYSYSEAVRRLVCVRGIKRMEGIACNDTQLFTCSDASQTVMNPPHLPC